jgi:hypothetical protein
VSKVDDVEISTTSDRPAPITWLRAFERAHARPLRVLHIGNIANNGYNNAKIQRNHGIEADVIAYDYYHIMGTPEWEDAEIKGSVGDAFYPDWWAVDLGAWQRPNWFVQGPILDAIAYLRVKAQGNTRDGNMLKRRLTLSYWHLVRHHQKLKDRSGQLRSPFHGRFADRTRAIAPEAMVRSAIGLQPQLRTRFPTGLSALVGQRLMGLSDARKLLNRFPKSLSALVGPRLMGLGDAQQLQSLYEHSRFKLCVGPRARLATAMLGRSSRPATTAAAARDREIILSSRGEVGLAAGLARDTSTLGYLGVRCALFLPVYAARRAARALRSYRAGVKLRALSDAVVTDDTGARRRAMHDAYRQHFADTDPRLIEADLRHAENLSGCFADVLGHYDIIQGYSTDGLIPLFAGVKTFAAYEHGTLREIPFEDTLQGRLCHFTYKMAPAVFVTNTDVLPSIPRIGIQPERVVHLPHAFNDAKLRAFRDANPDLAPPPGVPVFFSPTRHHWHNGDGSWLKGNDVFLRAAGRLAIEGRRFKLVLVEWGVEVAKSKALIEDLKFSHMVEWVAPMTKRDLWKAYCQAHAVIDQFTLPAIGGVAFETLALGRRLVTRIDEPTLAHFFGAAPPIFNSHDVDTVTQRLREVLDDPDDGTGRGLLGRHWIETYHSAERVVGLQLEAYEKILSQADVSKRPA